MNTNAPDFDSVVLEQITLPYDTSKTFLSATYSDPVLEHYRVVVIEDSLPAHGGNRLVTIAATYPRVIMAEVNTHRVFSRNSASSRARSVKTTIKDVMEKPYIPLFTKNRKGMSGVFLDAVERDEAEKIWLKGRDRAVDTMLELLLGVYYDPSRSVEESLDVYYDGIYGQDTDALSVHKQNANRLLEPFMWSESIITSSYWENFKKLRVARGATENSPQPEFDAIAVLIHECLEASTPVERNAHLPFVPSAMRESITDYSHVDSLRDVLMLSSNEAAQVSYRDKSTAVTSNATVSKGESLLASEHLSPFEHSAIDSAVFDDGGYPELFTSNLHPDWIQTRKIFLPNNMNES